VLATNIRRRDVGRVPVSGGLQESPISAQPAAITRYASPAGPKLDAEFDDADLAVTGLTNRRYRGDSSLLSVLLISEKVPANYVVVGIKDGFVAGDIRLAQNIDLSKEAFTLGQGGHGLALGIENSANSSGSIVFVDVGGHPDELFSTLNEDRARLRLFPVAPRPPR
jgi:hypothetical protein